MGAIGGMLGVKGGTSGTGIAGPQNATIVNPTTQAQVSGAQTGVTNALGGQDALLAALKGQMRPDTQANQLQQGGDLAHTLAGIQAGPNGQGLQQAAGVQQMGLNQGLSGLGGTSMMGNAAQGQSALNGGLAGANGVGAMQGAMAGQGNLAGELGWANGVKSQVEAQRDLRGIMGQQQGTLGQLQGIANGTGPNPAQAALNQATGANVANQAALMAGQRGAGANVGLMARQAGQQGAGIQQQAAGQSATMQAQQQLNAINAMGGLQQGMANTANSIGGIGAGLSGQQQTALGQQFGQGANTAGMLQTGLGQQYGQGLGAVNAEQTGIGQLYGQGSTATGQMQTQLGQNAGVAQNQIGNVAGLQGGAVQGNLGNQGQQFGAVGARNSADVGMTSNINAANAGLAGGVQKQQGQILGGGMNALGAAGSLLGGGGGGGGGAGGGGGTTGGAPQGPTSQSPTNAPVDTTGGNPPAEKTDTSVSEHEAYGGVIHGKAPRSAFGQFLASGGMVHDYRSGGPVQAKDAHEKATKGGNNYANDKIPAMLSEKEIVLPRTVTLSKNAPEAAKRFVEALQRKKGKAS